ncbi:MAG: hypothetical protein ACREIT_10575 [Tepidisphaeraceae bacterium]
MTVNTAIGAISSGQTWAGRWCWTHKHIAQPWNDYAYFRKTVDLPAEPRLRTLSPALSRRTGRGSKTAARRPPRRSATPGPSAARRPR